MLRIGLIKEGKVPSDRRVVLTPENARKLMDKYPQTVVVVVQENENRCFTNEEYRQFGIEIVREVFQCDLLLGVKEVPVNQLIEGKTYMFFSHTIKKQEHNRKLLQEILRKKIRLIDYECLHDEKGNRLIGFGRFAGIVGAQHALVMWGKFTGKYELKSAVEFTDLNQMFQENRSLNVGKCKIFVTGKGRVSNGVAELLEQSGVRRLNVLEYINYQGDEAVYCLCDMDELYVHREGKPFEFHHFYSNPEEYTCNFRKFMPYTDILINGMFWNPRAERLFELDDIRKNDFNIKLISDISCDLNGSVPLTTKITTIDNPYFAVRKKDLEPVAPFTQQAITLMTIDNLPNELPRDASAMFAEVMTNKILPMFIEDPENQIIYNATIAYDGKLNEPFAYLSDYVGHQ